MRRCRNRLVANAAASNGSTKPSSVTTDPAPKSQSARFGVPIARVRAYKLVTPEETRFYSFELTDDNKVAWYQSSAE